MGHSGPGLGPTGPTGRTCTYFTNGDLASTGPERRAAAVTAAPTERVNFFSMVVFLCVEAGVVPRLSRIAHSRALCGALRHDTGRLLLGRVDGFENDQAECECDGNCSGGRLDELGGVEGS